MASSVVRETLAIRSLSARYSLFVGLGAVLSLVGLILLGISLFLILACGVFVAAEFALVTVDRSTVDKAAAAGDKGAQGVQKALKSLSTQLSGAQVGITVTNLAIGFLAEPAIATLVRVRPNLRFLPTRKSSELSVSGNVCPCSSKLIVWNGRPGASGRPVCAKRIALEPL